MSRTILAIFIVFLSLFLASCGSDLPEEPDSPAPLGQATTDWYADPSGKLTINPEKIRLTESQSIELQVFVNNQEFVYKKGYVWTGNEWIVVTYEGQNIGNSNWLENSGTTTYPISANLFAEGTYYALAYACNSVASGGFDCNDNKWMLIPFEVEYVTDYPGQPILPGEYCADIYEPVCGESGQTHSNLCYLEQAGDVLAYEGECDSVVVCAQVYDPVCGTSGQTYSNECSLEQAGDTLDYAGECKDPVGVVFQDEWEAEAGQLDSKWFVENGALDHNGGELLTYADSNPQASYEFKVDKAGLYAVYGLTLAPSNTQDSFFVNVNSKPTQDNIWDVQQTTSFTKNQVRWRDQGLQTFQLSAGTHTLYVTGREAGTLVDKWYVELVSEVEISVCGNGVVNDNEVCEIGDSQTCSFNGQTGTAICRSDCLGYETCHVAETLPVCGNSKLETGEQCDDGNTLSGDGCSGTCQYESSGNECNDGKDNDGDGLTDWQYDLGCTGPNDATEGGKNAQLDNGWTVWEPQGAPIYYVSSSGSDSNDGKSPGKAFKTPAKALTVLKEDQATWILFKRGDTFYGHLNKKGHMTGESATKPVIFASYGESTVRPKFIVGSQTKVYGTVKKRWENVVYQGIHFQVPTRLPGNPAFSQDAAYNKGEKAFTFNGRGAKNIHFEDLKIEGFKEVLSLENWGNPNYSDGITMHRNVFVNQYRSTKESDVQNTRSSLMWTSNLKNHVVTENMIDTCGWYPADSLYDDAPPSVLNHCFYLSDANSNGFPAYIEGNIIARPSSHVWQMRASGSAINNLVLESNNGFIGTGVPAGRTVVKTAKNNVFTEGSDKLLLKEDGTTKNGGGAGTATGFYFATPAGSTLQSEICNNIMTRHLGGQRAAGVFGINVGSANPPIANNIVYNWGTEDDRVIDGKSSSTPFNPSSVPNAEVSVAGYLQSIGMQPSLDTLYEKMREQSKYNWDQRITADAINNYFRAGFGIGKC